MSLKIQIKELVEQVDQSFRAVDYDWALFPALAARHLAEFNGFDDLSLASLASLVTDGCGALQIDNSFSDLPLDLCRTPNFRAELLLWSNATTSLHQHAFSGAFRVVRGGSIHTRYAFEERHRINGDFQRGDLVLRGSESLAVGDVREIMPGRTGLIHSLYHLENPSITLVLRTAAHKEFGPQFDYFPPGLAFNRGVFTKDFELRSLIRLLSVLKPLDPDLFAKTLIERGASLDPSRLAWLFLMSPQLFDDPSLRDAFIKQVRVKNNSLADCLLDARTTREAQSRLIGMRKVVKDADLRFFLALLMNVPDRNDFMRLVSLRYPKHDPAERCASWLARLSVDETSAAEKMTEVARLLERSGITGMPFSRQLRRCLPPGCRRDAARRIFETFITEGNNPCSDADHSNDALESMQAVQQLAVFRRTIGSDD